jgi:hypothetical protein
MIRFEYDQPTAGMRVSFVIKDGEMSMPLSGTIPGKSTPSGVRVAEQSKENLLLIREMLDYVIESR